MGAILYILNLMTFNYILFGFAPMLGPFGWTIIPLKVL
jgi:hypothetical protein